MLHLRSGVARAPPRPLNGITLSRTGVHMRRIRILALFGIGLLGAGCAGPRYQVAVSGSTAVLLDTYTGETWCPYTADGKTAWVSTGPRLPDPRPDGRNTPPRHVTGPQRT